ncbi:MAG: fimbrillin family protein [Bacteroidales bacterium]|jgi:hypothetical protein|nr:fimbrillin family protein [Bacteroidales bacterium]
MIGASSTLETDNIVEDADNAPKTTGSYNKSAAPVDLQFSHKLVKLAFSIEVGAGVTESLDGLTVKITGQRFFFSPTNRSYDVGFRVVFFP